MLLPSIFGENLFDDFFDDVPFFDNRAENQIEKKLYGRHAHNVMKTDIKETDDGYELIVDLPGFKKDEIKVSLEDGYLTIEAARVWMRMSRRRNPASTSARNVMQVPASVASMLVTI